VLTEPTDLDRGEFVRLLERRWGLRDVELEHLPVGFGSHHWLARDSQGTRRFVTADDLDATFQRGPDADSSFAALERAFSTTSALRDQVQLEFVVAPLPDDEGAVIRRLSRRYAVTVSPFIEGTSGVFGSYEPRERRRMGQILGRLHAATEQVPAGVPHKEDFAVPSRDALREALEDLDRPWASGPFGEPARQLLRGSAHGIEPLFREYDRLVTEVRGTADSWVITHGEPHNANVLRDDHGGEFLVDWDTTLVAPRERDLRMVLDRDLTGWAEYVDVAGPVSLNPRALRLYELWWDLADIGIFVEHFRGPHERTEDDLAKWRVLTENLAARGR
jgi:spectinomycin phosphotransferase